MKRHLSFLLLTSFLLLLSACATPLGDAAGKGDLKTMRALLDQGQDVNEKDACGMNAGETALFCAVWAGNQPVAKLLLERGADVNAKTNWNMTPLDAAVGTGDVQMVQFLLERGAVTNNAQVQVCDSGGFDINMCTSLQYAKHTGNTKIARMLEYAEEKELAKLGVPASSVDSSACTGCVGERCGSRALRAGQSQAPCLCNRGGDRAVPAKAA
ncbi:MAG: ankyrin repeat domain-containing protein [Nitrospiraceae bacterium]